MRVSALQLVGGNLLSPAVAAFAAGAATSLIRPRVRVPEVMAAALSVYLLAAIGLKGGGALAAASPADVWAPALLTLLAGIAVPPAVYVIGRRLLGLGVADAASLAAHYGSVSIVTFGAAVVFLDATGVAHEGFMPALVALLEVPGILVALLLARVHGASHQSPLRAVGEVVTSKSIGLLALGLAAGFAATARGSADELTPVVLAPFPLALVAFLLVLGLTAARSARAVFALGLRLPLFALFAPLVLGLGGLAAATAVGLSQGGSVLFGVMAASASYIAAPAAVRLALPDANPALSLAAAIGVTFPFNLAVTIPLLAAIAGFVH